MWFPIEAVLFVFLIIMAYVVQRQGDLFAAAMLTGIFSLLSAGLFTLMDAADVAFTEAAVGAGISTVLFLATLALTSGKEKRTPRVEFVPLLAVLVAGGALLYGTVDMPHYGISDAPIHGGVARYYMERSGDEIGLPNVVTSILASYRGYDTFGELTVIFTAGVGVILLLARRRTADLPKNGEPVPEPAGAEPQPVRMMPVLRTVTKALIPVVLLFALYVQAHGDFGPGGGFQAGVIFAAGLIFYAMIYGPDALARIAPLWLIEIAICLGLLIYGGTGVLTMILGRHFLDYSALSPAHPQHGQHWGIFAVELGVGITVAAVMLTIYFRFAGRRA